MKKKKILFVCRYNHFRSIVAAEILRKYSKNLIVDSAGLEDQSRYKIPARAWKPAEKLGVKIRGHITKPLTNHKTKRFDKIYVFEKAQKKYIEHKFPAAKGKVFVIKLQLDLKGKPFEQQTVFVQDMRIILKKLSKEL